MKVFGSKRDPSTSIGMTSEAGRGFSTSVHVTRDDESQTGAEEILKKIRGLEIKTRALVETAFAGDYHSVFKGRGMNFEEEIGRASCRERV